ncbi:hypothetical protein HWV62_28806 [Athelia sp. TMB]|nr:hypothetical protein HWV62_28806 [Athelia sp. TMB]
MLESDVIYLNVLGTRIVVLNSYEAANELLEKRAAIYSSRPPFVVLWELMGWRGNFQTIPYGEFWRSHRRLFNDEFNQQGKASIWHHPYQMRAINEMLRKLLESPDKWKAHLRQQAGDTMLGSTYGMAAEKDRDPYIHAAGVLIHSASDSLTPGRYLVEILPWMKHVPAWIPGASFHTTAREGNKVVEAATSAPFERVKAAMVSVTSELTTRNVLRSGCKAKGTAKPCFTTRCLEKINKDDDISHQELVIQNVAGTMFNTGSYTSGITYITFILAMLKYPEVQAKAQQELDAVLGPNRIPSYTDKDLLPYLSAIVKECLRWEVLLPFSAPHLPIADDVYNGYLIPAGTLILPNTWAILHDETVYPEPERFNPDRFLTEDGKLDPSVRDPEVAFGYGRRICPGRHMARESIWQTAGSILACFNIEKSVDEQGNVIEPSGKYHPGFIRAPEPFACSIKPRSEESVKIIKELP